MALYETTFIARQDLSRADVTKMTDNFAQIITDNGGKIVKTEYWGLRNLAYKINKNRKGHYTMFGIDAPAAAINELNRQMGHNEEVVRTLTVRVESIEEGQSAIMNAARRDEEFAAGASEEAAAAN